METGSKTLLAAIAIAFTCALTGCSSDDAEAETAFTTTESDTSTNIDTVSAVSGAFEAGRYSFNGTINGKFSIEMNIEVDEQGSVNGEYWYTKKRIPIELRGSIKDGTVSLEEYSEGARTGIFSGSFTTPTLITGTWAAPDGSKTFPFTLAGTIDNTNFDMEESYESYDQTTSEMTSGNYDIDQYLDDYEAYLLKTIDIMGRMEGNDPQAMQEYMEVLQDAQEISEKLNGLQGQMEPRHIERFMEMQEKLQAASAKLGY